MKVRIDREGCIACGLCIEVCPEVFRFAEDGLSEVYEEPTEDVYDQVKEAAESCPVAVIDTKE